MLDIFADFRDTHPPFDGTCELNVRTCKNVCLFKQDLMRTIQTKHVNGRDLSAVPVAASAKRDSAAFG